MTIIEFDDKVEDAYIVYVDIERKSVTIPCRHCGFKMRYRGASHGDMHIVGDNFWVECKNCGESEAILVYDIKDYKKKEEAST